LNPDDSLGEQQDQKPHHELKAKETSVEVCRLADQLKEQEEKNQWCWWFLWTSQRRGRDKGTRAKFKSTPENYRPQQFYGGTFWPGNWRESFKKDSLLWWMVSTLNVETQEHETTLGDEPVWKQLFMNGTENREKALLT